MLALLVMIAIVAISARGFETSTVDYDRRQRRAARAFRRQMRRMRGGRS